MHHRDLRPRREAGECEHRKCEVAELAAYDGGLEMRRQAWEGRLEQELQHLWMRTAS